MSTLAIIRDRDVRAAVAAALEATRAFDGVYLAGLGDLAGRPAGSLRSVFIEPDQIQFDSRWDNVDQPGLVADARLSLTVLARDEEPLPRDEAAERLINVAANALNGRPLAGLTLPAFTRLVGLQWLPAQPPERRIRATFAYRYILESWCAFSETE
jgi:hypothetical protein